MELAVDLLQEMERKGAAPDVIILQVRRRGVRR